MPERRREKNEMHRRLRRFGSDCIAAPDNQRSLSLWQKIVGQKRRGAVVVARQPSEMKGIMFGVIAIGEPQRVADDLDERGTGIGGLGRTVHRQCCGNDDARRQYQTRLARRCPVGVSCQLEPRIFRCIFA